MKTNVRRHLFSVLLTVSLLCCSILPGFAQAAEETPKEEPPKKELTISSEEQFLQFAENCRIDDYSRALTVSLSRDLDLSGLSFQGIPLFLGSFQGNHHEISGIQITSDGSNLGLFRYLAEGSSVKNLTVSGTIAPEGSRLNIGGIAGVNLGTVVGCRFKGDVAGVDRIGGIAGVNGLQGIIEDCQIQGSITGDHFLGGAAGENKGVIRGCMNRSSVNTVPRENTVNVKSISIETITGTEAPSTVTDIGGIAGSSTGVIRDCTNRGDVGYLHMGYNVGGIAGSQVGYINGCQNYGKIYGRKEVGGITGQFEPISEIEYQIDTLQILEQQLSGASSLLNRAAYNAQGNMGSISAGIGSMLDSSEAARDAITQLTPEDLKDPDAIIAAHNAVKSNLQNMFHSLGSVGHATGAAAGQLSRDLKAVSAQMSAMGKTIKEANEHMGIRLSDVSDQDTDDNHSGKISNSQNFAPVSGDLNAGGITGSIAYENDLDPEDDLLITGDQSLNFDGSLRAVILNCENRGTVSAKKLHAGGIVGWMSMGMVKNSVNTGLLNAEKAQYVGGIAGSSRGFIRSCSVKCELMGSTCIGGIAGSGTIATDCLSMVNIREGSEKMGAILGIQEAPQAQSDEQPVSGNLYMSLSQDIGAIDGISYMGLAEPLAPYKFRSLPNLPETFRQVKLVFKGQDGSVITRLTLPLGEVFHPEQVPQVPQKEGHTGQWENLSEFVSQRVYFDTVFTPLYTPYRMTIASPQVRGNGRPILLAEGVFPEVSEISMEPMALPDLPDRELLEAWTLPVFSMEQNTELHLNQPDGSDISLLRILVKRENGSWEETESSINARHLVFSVQPGDTGFCVQAVPDYSGLTYVIASAVLVMLLLLIQGIRVHRNHKKRKKGKSGTVGQPS